jgi:hypothetical protein
LRKTIPGNRSVYEEILFGKRGNDLTRQDLFTHLAAQNLREAFSNLSAILRKVKRHENPENPSKVGGEGGEKRNPLGGVPRWDFLVPFWGG